MMDLNCEAVRDRLPEVLTGLAGPEAQAVLAHVADCPDCSAEMALINALRGSPERAPSGLSSRVRQAAVRPSLFMRHDLRRPALLAAAVGSVLLAGSLLMRGRADRTDDGPQTSAPAAAPGLATPAVGSGTATAPLAVSGPRAPTSAPDGRALMQALPGTPDAGLYSATVTLEDLSEEELTTLLKELQS